MKPPPAALMLLALAASAVRAERLFSDYEWSRIAEGIFLHGQADPLANSCDDLVDGGHIGGVTSIHPYRGSFMIPPIRRLTLAFVLGSSSLGSAQGGPDMLELVHPGADVRWIIVNDGVMGGISRSEVARTEDGNVLFAGTLSLENNGGFASTRVLLGDQDLSSFDALEFEVRGDGRTYQLRVRDGDGFDGVAFRAEFATISGEWQSLRIRFDELVPTFRGRVLSEVDPLDLSRVGQIGFLVADGRPGRFELEIRTIRAVSDPPGS